MGLEELSLKISQKGTIVVNKKMETTQQGIYAIGDVVGGYLLAHVASEEGIIAAENATKLTSEIDYTSVPSCIFTSPEIGTVGLTPDEAEEKEMEVRIARFPFTACGKAHAIGETDGFVQLIVRESDDKILGGQIVGSHAADLVHETGSAISMRLPRLPSAGSQ